MGWTGNKVYFLSKKGKAPTTSELVKAYFSAAGLCFPAQERLEVLASASRARKSHRDNQPYKSYTLWIYGKPSWGEYRGERATVFTVLLDIDWAGGEVLYKDFGLESIPWDMPPVRFVKALPESLGDDWADGQLAEIRAHYARQEALKKALVPGALVSFGEQVQFTNGVRARWLEVCTYYSRAGRRMKGLRIDGTPVRVNMGRDWVSRVQEYIPVGQVEPVVVPAV